MTSLRYIRTAVWLLVALTAMAATAESIAPGYAPEDGARGDCLVGNRNEPVGEPIENIFFGAETYAYYIHPIDQCACSEGGFAVETYNQLLHFRDGQYPVTFQVTAMLLEAIWDTGQNCWVPGPVIEQTLPHDFTVTDGGLFLVQVPGEMPDAYNLDGHFFLALRYEGGAPGQLPVDNQPLPCIEYIDRDATGWQDLITRDRPGGGKIIIWGDVVCALPSVIANEHQSWGSIKALFK